MSALLVSAEQLAEFLGISVQTVEKLTREGVFNLIDETTQEHAEEIDAALEDLTADKQTLAEIMNISERTFERLVQKGVLIPRENMDHAFPIGKGGKRQQFSLCTNLPRFIAYREDVKSAAHTPIYDVDSDDLELLDL